MEYAVIEDDGLATILTKEEAKEGLLEETLYIIKHSKTLILMRRKERPVG